ncbi:MAG: D-glycero-beta-D-manno-heptose 1-phosphate adenylyltransferase [Actinomycetota bacterium]|nr:D-glycero-beta-D-manno-heptose 1-phosphate adenylyltransferase [Actinomycetota bacterium]
MAGTDELGATSSRNLGHLTAAFRRVKLLVVGDVMLDRYLWGSSQRLCREGPVPIVEVEAVDDRPGGAGNAAANAAALGATTRLLTAVGDAAESDRIRLALAAAGVDADLFVSPGRPTLVKHRVMAHDQLLARFDLGQARPLGDGPERELGERLGRLFDEADAVIVSDYGYGVCSAALRATLAARQSATPRTLLVDARSPDLYREAGVTVSKPNYSEALKLLGVPPTSGPSRAEQIEEQADRLLESTGGQLVVVTLDSDGAVILERGQAPQRVAPRPAARGPVREANGRAGPTGTGREATRWGGPTGTGREGTRWGGPMLSTGAGDTFGAAFALAITAGADAVAAAEIASAAAAVVVGKPGTAVCSLEELQLQLGGEKKIDSLESVAAKADLYRRRGLRIVVTNGCFDILHRGHVAYLNRAKLLGDVLVVGVNSDRSVRRLKGSGRPVNPLDDRLHVLAALGCVDHVVPFDEETANRLVEAVRPDVYAKGGDYTREMLAEAETVERYGGAVEILAYVEDRSTTKLIDLIRDGEDQSRRGTPPHPRALERG